jgi:membrane-bound lytic murein transglycosylase D
VILLKNFFVSLILALTSGLLVSCANAPAPSSYAASHPHVYTPYAGANANQASSDEDQLTRLQLALLDPPNTMSMVGRAVENHRRAIEEEQRLRDFASRQIRTGKGKKGGKSLGVPGSLAQKSGTPIYQADLSGLGISCGTGYTGDKFSEPHLKSVMMQKSCLSPGDGRTASRGPKSGVRLSGIHGNLWDGVRAGLILHSIEHEKIKVFLDYLRQKPGTVDFLMGRAEPYLQYLLGELRREGLPADLILVPMVESAYQTTAVSPKQAAGLWQFVPSTGQQYGLRLSENYDGRYDTHLATQAALRYLGYLNELFGGDWTLALAAYNAGEGTVSRAIQANRTAGGRGTFWELSLPQETQNYVLKIITLSHIIADPSGNGFIPRNAQSTSSLTLVELRPGLKMVDLIEKTGINSGEFFKLNPHVRPDVIPPPEARTFMLPADKVQVLSMMASRNTRNAVLKKVKVNPGETSTDVAKRIGVPLKQLLEWNGLGPKQKLRGGQELTVQGV